MKYNYFVENENGEIIVNGNVEMVEVAEKIINIIGNGLYGLVYDNSTCEIMLIIENNKVKHKIE